MQTATYILAEPKYTISSELRIAAANSEQWAVDMLCHVS